MARFKKASDSIGGNGGGSKMQVAQRAKLQKKVEFRGILLHTASYKKSCLAMAQKSKMKTGESRIFFSKIIDSIGFWLANTILIEKKFQV